MQQSGEGESPNVRPKAKNSVFTFKLGGLGVLKTADLLQMRKCPFGVSFYGFADFEASADSLFCVLCLLFLSSFFFCQKTKNEQYIHKSDVTDSQHLNVTLSNINLEADLKLNYK